MSSTDSVVQCSLCGSAAMRGQHWLDEGPCGHVFHSGCIHMLKRSGSSVCPKCIADGDNIGGTDAATHTLDFGSCTKRILDAIAATAGPAKSALDEKPTKEEERAATAARRTMTAQAGAAAAAEMTENVDAGYGSELGQANAAVWLVEKRPHFDQLLDEGVTAQELAEGGLFWSQWTALGFDTEQFAEIDGDFVTAITMGLKREQLADIGLSVAARDLGLRIDDLHALYNGSFKAMTADQTLNASTLVALGGTVPAMRALQPPLYKSHLAAFKISASDWGTFLDLTPDVAREMGITQRDTELLDMTEDEVGLLLTGQRAKRWI